ncbi:MAG TPA: hypothetical protein VGN79_12390 [Devosia sp.]|nr:hypothetical protein [Devosia sp.]
MVENAGEVADPLLQLSLKPINRFDIMFMITQGRIRCLRKPNVTNLNEYISIWRFLSAFNVI